MVHIFSVAFAVMALTGTVSRDFGPPFVVNKKLLGSLCTGQKEFCKTFRFCVLILKDEKHLVKNLRLNSGYKNAQTLNLAAEYLHEIENFATNF